MLHMIMRVDSKLQGKTARIYLSDLPNYKDYIVKVRDKNNTLVGTYYTSNREEAIQEAQLALM